MMPPMTNIKMSAKDSASSPQSLKSQHPLQLTLSQMKKISLFTKERAFWERGKNQAAKKSNY
jgi:hypothetical protein